MKTNKKMNVLVALSALLLGQAFAADQAAPAAAVWGSSPARDTWTETSLAVIRDRMDDLKKAGDVEDFCPGFAEASEQQKEVCWLRIVGAMAKYESNFKTSDMFMMDDGTAAAVGLLGIEEGTCKNAPSRKELVDPSLNLECGINTIADLLVKGRAITRIKRSKTGGPDYREPKIIYPSDVWSTLRLPYVHGKYKLGHRDNIIAISKQYKNF